MLKEVTDVKSENKFQYSNKLNEITDTLGERVTAKESEDNARRSRKDGQPITCKAFITPV